MKEGDRKGTLNFSRRSCSILVMLRPLEISGVSDTVTELIQVLQADILVYRQGEALAVFYKELFHFFSFQVIYHFIDEQE